MAVMTAERSKAPDMNAQANNQPDKLVISRDELQTPEVEAALRERATVANTKSHYESANVRTRVAPPKQSVFRLAMVYLSLFGMLGGLVGWGLGQVLHLRPNPQKEALALLGERAEIEQNVASGFMTSSSVQPVLREIDRVGASNPFYALERDTTLAPADREARYAALAGREDWKRFIADMLLFALAGACIAAALSAAEPIVSNNRNMAIIHGIVGASLGALGGVAAGFLAELIRDNFIAGEAVTSTDRVFVLTQVLTWGTLGLFLSAAPGVAMRSPRRLLVGLAGGALGGIIGGFFYGPILQASESEMVSRLVALLAIGLTAGLATALVEDVIKDGWLKVLAGPIAGKQFVLYRDPTYIGSAPNSHIYLFNDKSVGRRHAAIHKTAAGYEIENLPLGTATRVNGRAVDRIKLLRGDEIEAGATRFNFGERPKT